MTLPNGITYVESDPIYSYIFSTRDGRYRQRHINLSRHMTYQGFPLNNVCNERCRQGKKTRLHALHMQPLFFTNFLMTASDAFSAVTHGVFHLIPRTARVTGFPVAA